MIDVDYNEYKKTIAENMKLIVENNRLKEVEKEHQKLNGELREEIERLNNIINELEEYICAIEYDERNYNETWQIAVRMHNKLKELKGVDKE